MPTDQLSLIFAALADPTRRSILTRLAEGQATVNELAEPFAVSLPAISRHLKVLEHAGLIARGRGRAGCGPSRSTRPWRGCSRASARGRLGWTGWTRTCAKRRAWRLNR